MTDHLAVLEEIREHGQFPHWLDLVDVASALDAAIALMRGQSWQQIETAPKHQYVLVACNGVTTVARFWPTEAGVHETRPMWEDLGCYELEVQPTHWQLLPAPPQQEPAE